MSLFQIHKRFIQMGEFCGAAPYRLKDHYFQKSTPAVLSSLLISCLNFSTLYRMIKNLIFSRETHSDKPFGYALIFDSVFFINYTSGFFVFAGIFSSRKKLISLMNHLSNHEIMRKTYDFEQKLIRKFSRIIYFVLFFTFFNLLSKIVIEARSHNNSYIDVILALPLLILCTLLMVQFLIAVQIIYLSYCRIQYELRVGKLTVAKLRQCSELDILLKDFGSVIETAYGPFNFFYIALSFLYVLTIELQIAECGPTGTEAINSYIICLPPLIIFVWFIWKCTLIPREVSFFFKSLR